MADIADVVYLNARVRTFDSSNSEASFIAVAGGKILALGKESEDAKKYIGENTKVFDVDNNVIIPGFVESHNHFNAVANQYGWVDVGITKCSTIPEVLQVIKEAASSLTVPKEEGALLPWVKCVGFDDTLVEECRNIHKDEIDSVCSEFPVWIWHPSLHRAYCNSKALEISNITEQTPNPDAGEFVKDKDGKLTGQLEEMPAFQCVYLHLNKTVDPRGKCDAMWNTALHFASKGVTSVQDLFVGKMLFQLYSIAFSRHTAENPFPVRVSVYSPPLWQDRPETTGVDPLFLRFAGYKLFADGSIQCHTACCKQPYEDEPSQSGQLAMQAEQLEQVVLKFHATDKQIAVHCNGDGAVEAFITAVEKAQKVKPRSDHRHRIEHCQIVSDEQLARMKAAGITASFFIGHVYFWGDRHRSRFLGEERAQRISPLKSALDAGLRFGLHCDCPVTPVNPLHSIWAAVVRKTKTNYELGADQKITVEQAIRAYTIDAAYINFEDDIKGSLEAGKLADFVVLSADPLNIPVDDILNININSTVVGGRIVYGNLSNAKL